MTRTASANQIQLMRDLIAAEEHLRTSNGVLAMANLRVAQAEEKVAELREKVNQFLRYEVEEA